MKLNGRARWVLFVGVALVGLALDYGTKQLVAGRISLGQAVPVLGGWFEIILVYNTGAIFGLNPRDLLPGFPTNLFFYVFSAIATALLVVYYRGLRGQGLLMHCGVALIMPGALGNLVDRVVSPTLGVIDFLKIDLGFWPANPWPIFNFADIYITCGVAIVLFEFFRESRHSSPDKGHAESSTADA